MKIGDIVELKLTKNFMEFPKIIELDKYYEKLIEKGVLKVVGYVNKEEFNKIMKK